MAQNKVPFCCSKIGNNRKVNYFGGSIVEDNPEIPTILCELSYLQWQIVIWSRPLLTSALSLVIGESIYTRFLKLRIVHHFCAGEMRAQQLDSAVDCRAMHVDIVSSVLSDSYCAATVTDSFPRLLRLNVADHRTNGNRVPKGFWQKIHDPCSESNIVPFNVFVASAIQNVYVTRNWRFVIFTEKKIVAVRVE